MERIKIGIAGVGAISQVAYLPGISEMEDFLITSICDTDIAKASAVAKKYNIPHVFDDYEDFLRNSDIDTVVIATPNFLHFPMLIGALEYGKDVICELPLCLKEKEINEIENIASRTERILFPAMNGRFRPDARVIHKTIGSGEIGTIIYSKAGWLKSLKKKVPSWRNRRAEAGGGAIMTLGTYVLDYMVWALDKEIDSVFATLHRNEEVEDSGIVIMKFKDGTFGTFEVSWTILFEKDFTYFNVYGNRGTAIMNPMKIEKLYEDQILDLTPRQPIKHPFIDSYRNMIGHFRDIKNGRARQLYTYKEANYILKIVLASYRSFETGTEEKIS